MSVINKKRVFGFDIARAISIITIVLYHSLGYGCGYYSHSVVRTIGYVSLAIFTFQSGFLMASRNDLHDCRFIVFIKKRLIRIWPLFFLSSVLLCLMGFNTWFPTLKSWVGLSPFWRPAPRTMWYAALLIFLYVITLFWARGGLLKQTLRFIVTMGFIVGIQLVFHSVDSRTFFYSSIYFLGIIVGQYYYDRFFLFVTTKKYIVLLVLLFFGVLTVQIFTNSFLLIWVNSFIGMVALLSIYVNLGEKKKNNKTWLSVFSKLSYASFCIYLFHREIFEGLLMLWKPSTQYQMIPYLGLLGLAIVIPLAYYIQKSYDGVIKKMNL